MNILTINKKEFQKGMTRDEDDDKGFLDPSSIGVNYFLSKAFTLIPMPQFTTASTIPSGEILASSYDQSYLGDDAYLVDEDGKFYIVDGEVVTYKQIDDVGSYSYGTTDMLVFKGNVYATSRTDIVRLTESMNTITKSWWTSTRGETALGTTYRHPLVVIEDTMYIADGNKIHTFDGTSSVYAAMSLPTNMNITTMIKSSDGRTLLVFASETVNYSHTKKSLATLYIIDTVTLEFTREIRIVDQVESAVNCNGTIYVTYGNKFGYLTDTGIKFLRDLEISKPIYGSRISVMEDVVLIAEENKILAYGDVNGNGNIFFYVSKSENPYNDIKNILAIKKSSTIDSDKIMVSYKDVSDNVRIKFLDLSARGTINQTIKTKKYILGRVWIRRIDIESEKLASGEYLTLSAIDKDKVSQQIGIYSYAIQGAVRTSRFDCNLLVDYIQLILEWKSFGIKQIKIYYENGE